jgi:hypothetical protein
MQSTAISRRPTIISADRSALPSQDVNEGIDVLEAVTLERKLSRTLRQRVQIVSLSDESHDQVAQILVTASKVA